MSEPSPYRPIEVSANLSENESTILDVPGVGSDVESFLLPEQVDALRVRLDDFALRTRLAGYISAQVHLSEIAERGDNSAITAEDLEEAAATAASNYDDLTSIAESKNGWPDGISADFVALALRDMEERNRQRREERQKQIRGERG